MLGLSFVHWLVVLSAAISIYGGSAYIRDTLTGKTKPNRVSWMMWALVALIGTGAALSAGADLWGTARIFLAGFIPLLVFVASFINKNSYWKLSFFDAVCGFFSLVALVCWGLAESPRIAILLAAIGDGFAALPTVVKTWRYPETETGTTFVASLISVLLVLPSIPVWNIENASFQVYLIVINTALVIAAYRQRFFKARN